MVLQPVRFGFLGAGGIAQGALAPAVHGAPSAVLHAVAARDPQRAASLRPAGAAYGNYQELIDDPEVEVVYLSLTNDRYLPWARAALAAGKHVLCEKPLALDAGQVGDLIAAARAANRLLVEAFWYRWHPRTRRLVELVAAGGLGRVRSIETEFSFAGMTTGRLDGDFRLDPALGGGALYDVGCYALSAADAVLGGGLRAESVEECRIGPTGVDLHVAATLSGAGGARVRIRCGIDDTDRQLIRVVGSTGSAEFSAGEAFTTRDLPCALTVTRTDGAGPAVDVEEFPAVNPYRMMVEAVAQRIRGREAFVVGLDHSLRVAQLADAIRAALPTA